MNRQMISMMAGVMALSLGIVPSVLEATGDGAPALDIFVGEALKNNPKIREAYNEWKVAEYKVKSVRSLDDPMFAATIPGEHVQTRVGPQEQKYSVSQKVPFPGKLGLKAKAQAKQAEALREQYEAAKNEIMREVKFTYFDLFWADRAVEVSEEEKSILEKLENVAQSKYESNQIPQQHVIKAQVELSQIIRKLLLLRQNRESLAARLNSLLDRPRSTEIGAVAAVEDADFSYKLDDLVGMVQQSRQELVMAELSVEKAEYEKSSAQMAYWPDFTFGAEYIEVGSGSTASPNDGQDAWMGMVAVNVPIWFGKLNAQVKEKEAALQAAKEKKEDIENRFEYEVQDIYFKIMAYKDIVLLYETALVPQAQQAFDASQTGFETGSISFLDWLDTERTFLQTRLAYYKAITDYHKSIAYLERVVGGSFKGGDHEQ